MSNEREGSAITCPECGVEVTHLRRHLKKVHPAAGTKSPAARPPRTRANRTDENSAGELWAKCPECRVPVRDAELFKHLLNCPGADVRRAEWVAEQAAAAAVASAAAEAISLPAEPVAETVAEAVEDSVAESVGEPIATVEMEVPQ